MSEQPIQLSAGRLPETVIATYDEEAITALLQALAAPENEKKQRVAGVAATWPRYLDAWVALGQLSTEPIERYAYFRVGYHRGLDTLRASGWREAATFGGFTKVTEGSFERSEAWHFRRKLSVRQMRPTGVRSFSASSIHLGYPKQNDPHRSDILWRAIITHGSRQSIPGAFWQTNGSLGGNGYESSRD